MNATLTELRRETSRVLRPVIHGAKTVTLTEHGQEVAEMAPTTARRTEINRRLDNFLRECSGLTVDWDAETARTWARLRHSREVKRQPQSLWDSLIDAMAIRHGMKI